MKATTTTGQARVIEHGYSLVPRKVFVTRGLGVHEKQLTSRELAMTDAGVEKMNMIKASSIIPPGCEFISIREGKKQLMIENPDFSRAVWEIYLGKKNIDDDIKKALVSRL